MITVITTGPAPDWPGCIASRSAILVNRWVFAVKWHRSLLAAPVQAALRGFLHCRHAYVIEVDCLGMDIPGYLAEIRKPYVCGQSTEHSFRPAFERLFRSIDPALMVINEPKHITDVDAPDLAFYRGDVAIGWCEAKDIGRDIRKFAATDCSKAQKVR